MKIKSIIGDAESKEVKPDFRVISQVLNETGFCNRNNNPLAWLDNGDEIAPEGAGRTRVRSSGRNFLRERRAAVKAQTIAH